ncbi:HNH endonuclease signature motif containing protein [Nocardioides sp. Kera G14]|uniref:HNH endonuclease signature motif containing protein n=1 Tax=Nocardioides sp. Kera G14 TaxID=2884264 RepID=UPI001D1254F3|nr:HNH endonuclease signature motif containing protein [Nocardioides sp. Kera G14]UDY24710.1 HNH endonuclease [Nocardioides sp. Kera G14]
MTSGSAAAVASGDADDSAAVFAEFRASQKRAQREEATQIKLAAQYASFHEVTDWQHAAPLLEKDEEIPGSEGELLLGGDGGTWVTEFAVAEFAASTGRTLRSGRLFLAQAIELVHRLPRVWAGVQAGRVDGWRARRIADATMTLPREAAAWVDGQVASRAQKVGLATLDRLVEEAIARFDPEQLVEDEAHELAARHVTSHLPRHGSATTMEMTSRLDIDDGLAFDAVLDDIADQIDPSLPKAVRRSMAVGMLARGEVAFNHQTTDGQGSKATVTVEPPTLNLVVRVAEGDTIASVHTLTGQRLGMVSVAQLQRWASHSKIVVKPVLDLNVEAVSTGRFAAGRLRDQVIELHRTCAFPHCNRPAEACDLDHTDAWTEDGPPDQTRTGNLACLCRHHHRVKTHTAWRYRQLEPGVHEWTSPHGLTFIVDRNGTTDLGGPDTMPGCAS